MKQAIIYTRFSPRPNADQAMSCEFQEEKARQYCEYHGFDVLAVYQDKCLSGKRADNRPGLQQALVHVCKVRGVLVVYTLARLARSTKDAIIISETLEKKNADLAIVTQQLDTSTPMGRAFFKIMAVIGELERETTAERTRNILRHMQDQGFRISGKPPFGYMLDPKNGGRYTEDKKGNLVKVPGRIIPDHNEQQAIVLMKRLHGQGFNLSQICRQLHKEGFKPRGKKFNHQTVKKVLGI